MRGIAEPIKRRKVFNFFRDKEVDIVLLQECHSSKNCVKIWRNLWGGEAYFCHGQTNARGVCILIKRSVNFKVTKTIRSHEGRRLTVEGFSNEKKISITNLYAPNVDDSHFFVEILSEILDSVVEYKIVGGDLNILLDPKLDRRGSQNVKISKAAQQVNEFIEENEWADVWRVMHENLFQFTWKKRNPTILSRLDYYIVPQGTLNLVTKCEISSCPYSDHSCIELEVTFDNSIKGKGFWKFNTSLLQDKTFVSEINKAIEHAEFRYSEYDPGLKFELVKMDCIEIAQQYSHIRASERKKQKLDLSRKLRTQEKRLACINLSAMNIVPTIGKINDKIDDIKTELNKIMDYEARGAAIRAKSRWFCTGRYAK